MGPGSGLRATGGLGTPGILCIPKKAYSPKPKPRNPRPTYGFSLPGPSFLSWYSVGGKPRLTGTGLAVRDAGIVRGASGFLRLREKGGISNCRVLQVASA